MKQLTLIEKRIWLIGDSWYKQLKDEFNKPYFTKMSSWLTAKRRETFATVYPRIQDTFNAFKATSYEDVRVVVIGQDPYYNGASNGVAFAINIHENVDIDGKIYKTPIVVPEPQSLKNIWKEIEDDYEFGKFMDRDNSLKCYTDQGVLFMNRVLTVEKGKPDSHAFIGWETFTNAIITKLNKHERRLVFMLWGNDAKKVKFQIEDRHLVLEANHPVARNGGFFGCKHFTKCNNFLKETNQDIINW